MTTGFSQYPWPRAILFGFLAQALAFLASILVITVYATYLALQVLGRPDQLLINHVAASYAPWITQISGICLTLILSRHLVRNAPRKAPALGVLVGLSSAVIPVIIGVSFHSHFSLRSVLVPLLLFLAGWFGVLLGSSHTAGGAKHE